MRYWTLEETNSALPRVAEVVERARAVAGSVKQQARVGAARARSNGEAVSAGVVGGLASAVRDLAAEGILLRDAEAGLIDFPARSPSGRDYWLCWVAGEPEVAWWHWPEDGFAGRTPIAQPPA